MLPDHVLTKYWSQYIYNKDHTHLFVLAYQHNVGLEKSRDRELSIVRYSIVCQNHEVPQGTIEKLHGVSSADVSPNPSLFAYW